MKWKSIERQEEEATNKDRTATDLNDKRYKKNHARRLHPLLISNLVECTMK